METSGKIWILDNNQHCRKYCQAQKQRQEDHESETRVGMQELNKNPIDHRCNRLKKELEILEDWEYGLVAEALLRMGQGPSLASSTAEAKKTNSGLGAAHL